MPQKENWAALIAAAKRDGWTVEDDGSFIEFRRMKIEKIYARGRTLRGMSSFQAACEDLQPYGVRISPAEKGESHE